MKKLLLAGLLIGSFAFGQQITVKKGSYCTGFSSIGGDFGNATGDYFRFYDTCNINGTEYKDVALAYNWVRGYNLDASKFFNKKLKSSHKTYINQGAKLEFYKNRELDLRGWGVSKRADFKFENTGYNNKTVKNYFEFENINYKKLPFTDEIK